MNELFIVKEELIIKTQNWIEIKRIDISRKLLLNKNQYI